MKDDRPRAKARGCPPEARAALAADIKMTCRNLFVAAQRVSIDQADARSPPGQWRILIRIAAPPLFCPQRLTYAPPRLAGVRPATRRPTSSPMLSLEMTSETNRGIRCAALARISPRSAPPTRGRPIDHAVGQACARRMRVCATRASWPDQGQDNRNSRRRAQVLRRKAGGPRWTATRLHIPRPEDRTRDGVSARMGANTSRRAPADARLRCHHHRSHHHHRDGCGREPAIIPRHLSTCCPNHAV